MVITSDCFIAFLESIDGCYHEYTWEGAFHVCYKGKKIWLFFPDGCIKLLGITTCLQDLSLENHIDNLRKFVDENKDCNCPWAR